MAQQQSRLKWQKSVPCRTIKQEIPKLKETEQSIALQWEALVQAWKDLFRLLQRPSLYGAKQLDLATLREAEREARQMLHDFAKSHA